MAFGSTSNVNITINAKDNASHVFKNVGESATGLGKVFKYAIGGAAVAGVISLTKSAVSLGIKTSASLETAQKGFETLLGSTESARKTMNLIRREAARTPFEVKGLTQAVQLMSSITKDGEKATKIVLDVGEALAAMGKGQEELDRISVNLQQIGAIGHASMLDVKQFAFAGIPIFEMLQKQTGLSGEALDNFIEDGQVSFDLLTKMFDKANDKGGRFFGAFQNQTGTLNQLISNFKDNLSLLLSDFINSTGVFDAVKSAIGFINDEFTGLKDNWELYVRPEIDKLKDSLSELGTNLSIAGGNASGTKNDVNGLTDAIIIMLKFMDRLVGITNAITNAWNGAVESLSNFFLKIIETKKAVKDFIKPLQDLSDKINNLPGMGTISRIGSAISGNILPLITKKQTGGIVPGRPGEAVPIIAHGGEMVSNPHLGQGNTSNSYNMNISLNSQSAVEMFFRKMENKEIADKFGVASSV